MAITLYDYHYAGQIRRFLEQIVRGFSGFQWESGQTSVAPTLNVVPCTLATTNRQVANILRNNSENTSLTAPQIVVWPTGIRFDQERQQSPNFISSVRVVERKVDPATNTYTGERGNAYTVHRFMPMAFELTVDAYLWTTNLEQKFQIFEQIATTFAIGFDIQNSDNPLDWTSLTTIRLDDIVLSSQNVPIGSENDVTDILTLTFKLPIWLSPPAKLIQQKVITQVIANIRDATDVDLHGGEAKSFDECVTDGHLASGDYSSATTLAQVIVTPGDHQIQVNSKPTSNATLGEITLLGPEGAILDPVGNIYEWPALLDQYGILKPTSQVVILATPDIENFTNAVRGFVTVDPMRANVLLWQVDPTTLRANTLLPITAILNPMLTFPGYNLAAPAVGQRYLLVHDLGAPTVAWGNVTAQANDIIEYQLGGWVVSFHSSTTTPQYVLNQLTGKQLHWTGSEWQVAVDGEYLPDFWRLYL